MSATPTGSGGDFSLILTRGLRPLAMIWHPYGMLQNGMLRIRFFLQKICVNLRNLRLKTVVKKSRRWKYKTPGYGGPGVNCVSP